MPVVAIVVGTSGSMADGELAAARAEVRGVLRAVSVRGDRVAVTSCDARVHAMNRVRTVDDVTFRGRGGTDLRERIAAAADVVIVLTDGHTPWPDAPVPRRPRSRPCGSIGHRGDLQPERGGEGGSADAENPFRTAGAVLRGGGPGPL